MGERHPGDVAAAFFIRMFRPIASIMLRYGISFREMSELTKKVYVDIATADYGENGAPANVSRVALLTGMTRRDVRNARLETDIAEQDAISRTNYAARVLSSWFQDEDFCDDAGRPLPLRESGEFPSFHDLARRHAPDIPVSTTLRALKDAAAVVDDEHGMGLLVAKTRYYMPGSENPATPEAVSRSGSVLEDLGNTVEYNLARGSDQPPRFERRATNTRVAQEFVGEFRRFINTEGQAFLERVDAWLSEHEVSGDDAGRQQVRLGLGMYWIEGGSR